MNWVAKGVKVAVCQDYGPGYKRYALIDKVHKNGNFTIEGSSQQYRPYSDCGIATGQFTRGSVKHVNDTNRAEIEEYFHMQECVGILWKEIERLKELIASGNKKYIIIEAAILKDR